MPWSPAPIVQTPTVYCWKSPAVAKQLPGWLRWSSHAREETMARHHHTHTHKSLASSSPPSPHLSMAMAKFLRSGGEWALESNIGALIITCTLLGVPSYSSRMIYPKTRFELFKVTKQDKRKERYKLTNDNPTNGPTGAFKIRKRIPERRKTALNPKP